MTPHTDTAAFLADDGTPDWAGSMPRRLRTLLDAMPSAASTAVLVKVGER
ncbi:hypothetical protein ACWEGS_13980 [Streptomyces sp. NPDC004822]